MKKTFKRILASLLAVVMLCGVAPAMNYGITASAAEVYSGTCGDNLTWTLDTETGELVISGTGEMWDYDYMGDVICGHAPWLFHHEEYIPDVKTVVINEGVTSIGDFAFLGWENILYESILLPNSIEKIGQGAFYGCESLENISVGDNVKYIDDAAFYGTGFYLDESNWNDGVLYLGKYLIKAKEDKQSDYSILNGTTLIANGAFFDCTSLSKIEIPDSVTSIGDSAFSGCDSLTNVTLPDSVTSIGDSAFSSCDSLTSVTIGDSVTSIGDSAFSSCDSLTSVTLPDSVTSIGDFAFSDCVNLTSIAIPDSVTSIGRYAFYNTAYYNNQDNWENGVLYIDNHLIEAEDTVSGDYITKDGSKTIAEYAFGECSGLTSIEITNSVTSIGDQAFYFCCNLTSVTIPDSVASIGSQAFSGCEKLTSISVDEENVVYSSDEYGVLFDKAKSVLIQYSIGTERISYTIPDSVTKIGDFAFELCVSLTSITIPDSVTNIGDYAFGYCGNLENATIGNSVTSIGDWAFDDCDSLTNVTIPDSVTSIGDYAFDDCDSLTNVTIGDSVTNIGDRAFYDCTSLTNVTIGNSVTSIGDSAFESCDSLTSITIPESVTIIDYYAFYDCDSLTDVYYNGTEEEWNEVVIEEENDALLEATIHFLGESEHVCAYTSAITKEATCTETGIMTYTCSCGDSYTEIIPKAEHKTTHIVNESSCKENGVEYDWCSACGESFNKTELPLGECKTEHITVASTCKVAGMEYDICTVCGKTSNSKVLPLADHSTTHVKVDSTCKEQGYEFDQCSVCGEKLNYVDLPFAEHKNKHITVASTCTVAGMEYDICTVCGKTSNSKVLPLASHTWGEWVVVREATGKLEGLKERSCTFCGTKEEEIIPKLIVVVDNESGIEIEYSDEYESGIELEVTEVFDGASFQLLDLTYGNNQSEIFDINTLKDGVKVQPDGGVKVRIPLPEEFNTENVFVCYVDSVSGAVTAIPCKVVDGYVEFTAEHFSHYAIVEILGKVQSVSIDDISMNYKDSATVVPNIAVDEGVEYTVTYSSSNTDVVTVDENGNITTHDKGSATITVTVTDEYGNTVSDTCDVEVKYNWWQWIIVIVLFGWIWY